jgi:hypothetical protein
MIRTFFEWDTLYEKLTADQEETYKKVVRSEYGERRLEQIFDRIRRIPGANTFDQEERVYIPFTPSDDYVESDLKDEIEKVLVSKGYELQDYRQGVVKDSYNRSVRIGKVLTKLGLNDLVVKFRDDPSRETIKIPKEMLLAFSHAKIDIAGMSTDRGWTSCMHLETGVNKEYVSCDIEEGSIICYLIKKEDIEINKPTARILIKPYVNMFSPDDIVYFPDPNDYGTAPQNFKPTIDKIMIEIQRDKEGTYRRALSLYDEKRKEIRKGVILKSKEEMVGTVTKRTFAALSGEEPFTTKQEIETALDELIIGNYKVHDDLTVDVFEDVDMSGLEMSVFPWKFGTIKGNFNCSSNFLKNLIGSPRIVTENFECVSNKLTTLEGAPLEVGGTLFACDGNELKDLKYLPKFTNPMELFISCSDNKLTTLEGCPREVYQLSCENNNMESLKGAPLRCSYIDVSNNKIKRFDTKIKVSFGFSCIDNDPPLTKELIKQMVKMISADSYDVGTEENKVIIHSNVRSVSYIGDKDKNATTMIKKFDDWINESLHSGVPVDFFKKIHQYSKNRPINIQDDITDALVNNDLEDVSHHFYELGTNPPEKGD